MSKEKSYKVSFKTYQNDRLNKVNFQGKEIYPLYIQISFDRKTIYFKSYYFDLLAKPQYVIRHFTGNKVPSISEVIAKEEKLINYIVDKHTDSFSLDLFKEWYIRYSRDLLSMMEQGFKDYLYVFFNDEGFNLLGSMVKQIGQYESGIAILDGILNAIKPVLAERLLKNAAYYAPSYLPLMTLAKMNSAGFLPTLSVFEWLNPGIQKSLGILTKKDFANYNINKVREHVQNLIAK
jgi:hypothetical protein